MALFCGHCQKYYDPGDPSKVIGCDCEGAVAYRKSKIDDQIRSAIERKNGIAEQVQKLKDVKKDEEDLAKFRSEARTMEQLRAFFAVALCTIEPGVDARRGLTDEEIETLIRSVVPESMIK